MKARVGIDPTEMLAWELHKVESHREKVLRIAPAYENSD